MVQLHKLTLFLAFLLLPYTLSGERIQLGDISIEIPDSITTKSSESMLCIIEQPDYYIAIRTIGDPTLSKSIKFDRARSIASMDTACFNMSNYACTGQEVVNSPNYRKSHALRTYRHLKDTTLQATTYTFYTPNRPYCITCGHPAGKSPSVLTQIITSIHDDSSLWTRIWDELCEGWSYPLTAFLITLLAAQAIGWFVDREKRANTVTWVLTPIAVGVFIYLVPGCWVLTALSIPCAIAGCNWGISTSFVDFFNSIIDGL